MPGGRAIEERIFLKIIFSSVAPSLGLARLVLKVMEMGRSLDYAGIGGGFGWSVGVRAGVAGDVPGDPPVFPLVNSLDNTALFFFSFLFYSTIYVPIIANRL